MITTVTPNPSIDTTIGVKLLEPGEVHRAQQSIHQAGGKGVNVASALMTEGLEAQAIFTCGHVAGSKYLGLVSELNVPAVVVDSGMAPRTNITVIEADGRTTKLNEPGSTVTSEHIDQLVAAVAQAAEESDWIVAAGSLAPGMPTDMYARLAAAIESADCRLAIDASGDALAAVLDCPGVVLKPNLEELDAIWPTPITTRSEGIAAAQEIVARGPAAVLLSLGSEGAVLIAAGEVVAGRSPVAEVRNTVGAGDSLLAGYVAGMIRSDGSNVEALRTALAWGRAAVRTAGTGLTSVEPEDVDAVMIDPIPPTATGD